MAILTLDGAGAGAIPLRRFMKVATPTLVVGKPQSLWALAGFPGAGAFDTTLNGVNLVGNAVAGQIDRTNPTAGNSYLQRFVAQATNPGTLLLCDRLWHNGGYTITTTTAQNTTQPTLPARDVNGATAGVGVLVGLEVSAAAGAAAPAPTLTYTNQAGTGSKTAGLAFPTANSPVAGSFFPFALAAGDSGVRSVQSLALNTSWISGTVNLVAYRVIAELPILAAGVPNSMDFTSGAFQRIYDNSVPFHLWVPGVVTATSIGGSIVETQG